MARIKVMRGYLVLLRGTGNTPMATQGATGYHRPMTFQIFARTSGAALTYRAETEEAALAKADALRGEGASFEIWDNASGLRVLEGELQDRIAARGAFDA
ncbi:MAG: hypothetical protein ABIO37_10975 [Caulobacteraceae bacterium]